VAFLESEAGQGNQDMNGNGGVFDSILRIFRVGPSGAGGITSAPLTGEAALAFAGRFGAWLGERLFFRTMEAREAAQTTERVSVGSAGSQGNSVSWVPSMSADGRFVAFNSNASNLVPGDTNGVGDVFARGVDTGPAGPADHSRDGVLDDTVLRVADASGVSAVVKDLCPADEAVASGSLVAFLRPEAAGISGAAACPEANADRNGDGDTQDHVVELYDGASVASLRCAATDLALSTTRLAALVSEADEGLNLGGGAGLGERILFVRSASAAAPPSTARCNDPGSGWTNTGQPGDAIGISGDVVTLLAPGTGAQRVIRLVNGATGQMIPLFSDAQGSSPIGPPIPSPAREFVQGSSLVAFRTSEADAGKDLNGDGDRADNVLEVLVVQDITTSSGLETLATGLLVNTGQAVTPCALPECDASKPYRVSADTVRFLTLESEQDQDLNQDGDLQDLVVQVFNIQSGRANVVAVLSPPSATSVPGTGSDPLLAPSDADPTAPSSQLVVTQGRCVEESQVSCSKTSSACAAGAFCFVEGTATTGTCVRDTGASCYLDRPVGAQGCLAGATCVRDFVVLGIADHDGDQVPDGIDDCPEQANTDQADADHDGVGDVCDLQTCGNGAVELAEQCDDGNLLDGDGCDSNCRVTACGNGILTAGEECDDGNLIAGDGCSPDCLFAEKPEDADGDSVLDPLDNCRLMPNLDQADQDADGVGNACDNCTAIKNADQRDSDGDSYGSLCDADLNNDGVVNFADLAIMKKVFFSTNSVADLNGDGTVDFADLAKLKSVFFQRCQP